MSDKWISIPKQWCKECRVFVDARPSRLVQHKTSERHQRNMQKMKRINQNHSREQEAIKRQIQDIERAALINSSSNSVNNTSKGKHENKFKKRKKSKTANRSPRENASQPVRLSAPGTVVSPPKLQYFPPPDSQMLDQPPPGLKNTNTLPEIVLPPPGINRRNRTDDAKPKNSEQEPRVIGPWKVIKYDEISSSSDDEDDKKVRSIIISETKPLEKTMPLPELDKVETSTPKPISMKFTKTIPKSKKKRK